MPGFFNKENKWRAAMQATNGLFLMMTAYRMFSDPETVWENGFEVAALALNVVTFSENDNALTSIGNAAFNIMGLGTVYAAATLGCSSKSLAESAGNAALYFANALTSICYKYEPNQERAQESQVKTM
ncbi:MULTISPECIES: hypothetical protein [Legionella]|uniref:Uncharacterized protein n=1 Tax=Legionella resiliens TaxID=2905958 RepID=A0ABS8X7B9_9GAMM|nr:MULTISPECIES: hypothetical protein [unclassified Legionella]MCE0724643.1 hypothetical protein [Legionella sp. 9fVS26]MCE3533797.1 hypothetical protein [Legionella sp. 8cVS16]QLZ69996.1 hypothetical protein FOLKNPGA_02796 [Legionella sp. PC1000]